jgi:hypothetical protein
MTIDARINMALNRGRVDTQRKPRSGVAAIREAYRAGREAKAALMYERSRGIRRDGERLNTYYHDQAVKSRSRVADRLCWARLFKPCNVATAPKPLTWREAIAYRIRRARVWLALKVGGDWVEEA